MCGIIPVGLTMTQQVELEKVITHFFFLPMSSVHNLLPAIIFRSYSHSLFFLAKGGENVFELKQNQMDGDD